MKRRNKNQLYIRLMNGREKSGNFRTACRLALADARKKEGKKMYVLVQRGRSNNAIEVGLIGGKFELNKRLFGNLKSINRSIRKKMTTKN